MKKISILSLCALFTIATVFTGCDAIKNTNKAQRGAGIGVLAGGILGAVIGNNVGGGGNGALGAAIGAAVGGGAGAIIGHQMDKQAREIDEALPGADVERVGEGIHLILKEDAIRFETNKATLTTQAKANLDKLVPVFKDYAETNISVYGYTDNTGKPEYNLKLSANRAASVKQYLASKGLVNTRLTTSGLGIADPIASNDTAEGKSQNRRVEFAITANSKMVEAAKKEGGN
jgi:outer membrane protein OmpA-like peptidoglycan-associated protein